MKDAAVICWMQFLMMLMMTTMTMTTTLMEVIA